MESFQRTPIPFVEFFLALIQALTAEGVRYCILRNYEGFPELNSGNDIDFLISAHQLPLAIRAIQSIQGVRVVGYAERSYVANVFVEGISRPGGDRTLEIDFDLTLSWKGLPFLDTEAVLNPAIPRVAGEVSFFVPAPIHESITSLFTRLVIAGQLKEKYFPGVQRTFVENRLDVIAVLRPTFGLKTAMRLVDSVIDGDRRKVLDCVRPLRTSLAVRSLLRRPVRSLLAIVRHYTNEIAFRFSSETLETLSILSPNGSVRANVVDSLVSMLRSSATVEKQHLPQPSTLEQQAPEAVPDASFETVVPMNRLLSMAMAVFWLVGAWTKRLSARRHLTLHLWQTCYADVLIAPRKFRYAGPMWFARLTGRLFPASDLWVLLDPGNGDCQSSGREAPQAETRRELEAYRAFVKTRKRYVILDAVQPTDRVTEYAYDAIIATLAQITNEKLKRRF